MSFSENTSDSDWKEAKIKLKLSSNSTGCGKQKYSQKFCEKWLSLFDPWLKRSADDPNKPFCRACQCRLDCNRCHLVRHERTTKHKRNLESLMTKGEGAVRKELNVRRERSKYYHQRKSSALKTTTKQEPVVTETNLLETVATAVITTDDVIEESSHNFEVMEATAHGQPQTAPTGIATTQATLTAANPPKNTAKASPPVINRSSNSTSNKDGLKLLMQIQQDKNELMESFRELIGVQLPHPPLPREKNHVDLFFDSVSSSVKALSPKLVAEAKMRVSQLICELELRALKDNGTNGHNTVGGLEMPVTGPHSILHHPQFGTLT